MMMYSIIILLLPLILTISEVKLAAADLFVGDNSASANSCNDFPGKARKICQNFCHKHRCHELEVHDSESMSYRSTEDESKASMSVSKASKSVSKASKSVSKASKSASKASKSASKASKTYKYPKLKKKCDKLYERFVKVTGKSPPCLFELPQPQGDTTMSPTASPTISTTTRSSMTDVIRSLTYDVGGDSASEEAFFITDTLDSDLYEIVYNGTLRQQGVVSLTDAALEYITSVTCDGDGNEGTIEINFVAPVDASVLFPIGSMLAVDSEAFGSCDLGLVLLPSFNETKQNRLQITDGYLLVETVSETNTRVVVQGTPSNYFFMFESGSFFLLRQTNNDSASRRQLATQTWTRSKTFTPHPMLGAEAEASLTITGGIDVIEADWDLAGLDLSVSLFSETFVDASLTVIVREGDLFNFEKQEELLSLPLYGFPNIPFFKKFKVPKLKFGVFGELDYLTKAQLSLDATFTAEWNWGATTGRKEFRYDISGGWTGLSISETVIKDETPSITTPSLTPDTYTIDGESQFSFGAFFGFVPRLAIYIGSLGEVTLESEMGLEADGALRIPPPIGVFNPLDPVAESIREEVAIVGPCETCHFAETAFNLVIRAPEFVATMHLKYESLLIDIDKSYTFTYTFESIMFTEGVLIWCLLGSNTLVCGDTCCRTCEEWVDAERQRGFDWVDAVEAEIECPCTEEEASSSNPELSRADDLLSLFHPGADTCFRGRVDSHGQQCCYANGRPGINSCTDDDPCELITSGPGAGSLDIVSSLGGLDAVISHNMEDVQPFYLCGGTSGWEKYSQARPISNARDCGTEVPTMTPTTTLSPTPSPTPPVPGAPPGIGPPTSKIDGADSRASGDPHIKTFGGLQYDCQGEGEFGMVQSLDSSFTIQGRFVRFGPRQITVTRGILVRDVGSPIIQVSEATTDDASVVIGGCRVHLFLDGVLIRGPFPNVLDRTFDDTIEGVKIGLGPTSFRVTYDTGVDIVVAVAQTSTFGCWMHSSVHIPFTYRSDEMLIGILGSANENAPDGWLTRQGVPLSFTGSGIQDGYEYCVTHWFLTETESLFSYESGASYDDFANPAPFTTQIDLSNADPQVQEFCKGNQECLLEGLLGGIDAARDLQQIDAGLQIMRGGGDFLTSDTAFALAGATVIDFSNVTAGTYTDPLEYQGVTFDPGPRYFEVTTEYSGRYNMVGLHLQNYIGGFRRLEITFENGPVTAFGFDWGASNAVWTMTGYDIAGDAVASYELPILGAGGGFFGITGTPMFKVVIEQQLENTGLWTDWILLDDFSFVPLATGSVGEGTPAPSLGPSSIFLN